MALLSCRSTVRVTRCASESTAPAFICRIRRCKPEIVRRKEFSDLRAGSTIRGVAVVRASSGHLEAERRVAQEGDIVTVHFTLKEEDGTVLQSSREEGGEPITFEVGAGKLFGNQLYWALDMVVKGLAVGESNVLEAQGEAWDKDLLFEVPANHPEVERLQGRYKNVGGLAEGLVVELSNGKFASVVEVTPEYVRLDANNALAGQRRFFELELISIDPKV